MSWEEGVEGDEQNGCRGVEDTGPQLGNESVMATRDAA